MILYVLVFLSGVAALSWEVIWQIHASLAIGVSALGTAITLSATMAGMTLGTLAAGRALRGRVLARPARLYALLELIIGLAGALTLAPGFRLLLRADSVLFLAHPTLTPILQLVGILGIIGLPAAAMGATIPVFGLMARGVDGSIATLYGLNTLGAGGGVLLATFALLPSLGVELTSISLACINLAVALIAWLLPEPTRGRSREDGGEAVPTIADRKDLLVVFVTGFAILGLEVAWFRALRTAFHTTTDSFAVMLTAVLLALGLGAPVSRWTAGHMTPVSRVLAAGALAVLCATPVLERFDLVLGATFRHAYPVVVAGRLAASVAVVGPPMMILGSCLPRVLARYQGTMAWANVYTVSTLGAAVGSVATGWVLLPTFGSERTAWVLGSLIVLCALVIATGREHLVALGTAAVGLSAARATDSGAWRARLQGEFESPVVNVLTVAEGPDASIAVGDDAAGDRVLVIDGFVATSQGNVGHYMRWMGRLPMLAHPAPSRALVICFGTGQTANAVREEGPDELDIVELNPSIYRLAPYFASNRGVLDDPRVRAVTMDGRAWLRRTDRTYDVVTLEPMPPTFAGVNALYSREFYRLVASRLRPGGVVAQWLPFRLLSPETAVAITATFQETFGDALLWVDPLDESGILVGRLGPPSDDLGRLWAGLARPGEHRDMTPEQIAAAVVLEPKEVAAYAALGDIVTDDNQLLAYRLRQADARLAGQDTLPANFALLRHVRQNRKRALTP